MTENFTALTILLNDLAAIEIVYVDEELFSIVLDAVPPSWEIFSSMLALTSRNNLPTFFQLENLFKEEEACRTSRAFVGEEALYA